MEDEGLENLTISVSPPAGAAALPSPTQSQSISISLSPSSSPSQSPPIDDDPPICHQSEDQTANSIVPESLSRLRTPTQHPITTIPSVDIAFLLSPLSGADKAPASDASIAAPTLTISPDANTSTSSYAMAETSATSLSQHQNMRARKKSVLFDTVEVYHFTRSQGFISIPSQGGSTLGMKRRHFFKRKLSVDLFEEVRRRSRREILLKIRFDKHRTNKDDCEKLHCNSVSSSTSSNSNTTTSDSDDESYSDYCDISDSELESESYIFLQPIDVKLRRSLLRASGIGRIDPKEKKDCKFIRDSRERSGCKCVNQCIPGLCECSLLGVNCHVDRVSFPCGCVSAGCQNPQGRTEFDIKRVKGHMYETLYKVGIG